MLAGAALVLACRLKLFPPSRAGDGRHRQPFSNEPTLSSSLGTALRVRRREVRAMSGSCLKCGTSLEAPWKFCPHCGAVNAPAPHNHSEPKHEKAPVKYAFGGLLFGLVTAPVLIIYGALICLLGPAMVLGIPMIIAGICAPLLGPYLAINAVRGKCPWCGAKISSVGPLDAFYCHACSKRIVVVEREMLRAE